MTEQLEKYIPALETYREALNNHSLIVNLYEELGFINNLDLDTSILNDIDNDYLVLAEGRDGNRYFWYLDCECGQNAAVNLSTFDIIDDEEELDRLFC